MACGVLLRASEGCAGLAVSHLPFTGGRRAGGGSGHPVFRSRKSWWETATDFADRFLKKQTGSESRSSISVSNTTGKSRWIHVFHIKNKLIVQVVEAWKRNFARRGKIDAEKSFLKCF